MSSYTSTSTNTTRYPSKLSVKDPKSAQSEHRPDDTEVDDDVNEFMTAGFTEHQYDVPRSQALQAAYSASSNKSKYKLTEGTDEDEYEIILDFDDDGPSTEAYMTAGFSEHQFNVPRSQALLAAYQASPSGDMAEYVHVEGPDDDEYSVEEPFMSAGFTEHQFAGTSIPREQVVMAAYHASREAYKAKPPPIKKRNTPFASILGL